MSVEDYWVEAVSIALEEMGLYDKFTSEQIKELGHAMYISADNQSQAFGWDQIPNPLQTEIKQLEQKRKQDDVASERTRERYFQALCRAYNVSPERVWFNERDGVLELRR